MRGVRRLLLAFPFLAFIGCGGEQWWQLYSTSSTTTNVFLVLEPCQHLIGRKRHPEGSSTNYSGKWLYWINNDYRNGVAVGSFNLPCECGRISR